MAAALLLAGSSTTQSMDHVSQIMPQARYRPLPVERLPCIPDERGAERRREIFDIAQDYEIADNEFLPTVPLGLGYPVEETLRLLGERIHIGGFAS